MELCLDALNVKKKYACLKYVAPYSEKSKIERE